MDSVGQMPSSPSMGRQRGGSLRSNSSIRDTVNHQPESRARDNRLHGSEGGEAGATGLP